MLIKFTKGVIVSDSIVGIIKADDGTAVVLTNGGTNVQTEVQYDNFVGEFKRITGEDEAEESEENK